jgi:hypothetical protein
MTERSAYWLTGEKAGSLRRIAESVIRSEEPKSKRTLATAAEKLKHLLEKLAWRR